MQFRTKARAIDLLGKGQIADLPTAITELWKNGYDAYADNVGLDVYQTGYKGLNSPCVVVWDDGKGMNYDDIFDKWLVLGSDSKTSRELDVCGYETLYKNPRVKSGEKGIGRLSVAYLGSPMLMLTKKRGYPLQMMLFDWRILEDHSLFIDDIDIPVADLAQECDFDSKFKELCFALENNYSAKKNKNFQISIGEQKVELYPLLIKTIGSLSLTQTFVGELLEGMTDLVDDNGTKFVIFEPEVQLLNLISTEQKEDDLDDVDNFRASLVGLINEFKEKGDRGRLPLSCKIRYFLPGSQNPIDYYNSFGRFFEPNDFRLADVLIDGVFDGNGDFCGTLQLYDEKVDYHYHNPRKKERGSYYGLCGFKLGYSMGNSRDSKLNGEAWDVINKRVGMYGGLYIYRDGFRVLPYGRGDFDFIGLEQERLSRLGSGVFSYRRIFGYIEITREGNPRLIDKSSREGLTNNAAYRAFRDDLRGMFKNIADEYMSDRAHQDVFREKKLKYRNEHALLKQDIDRVKGYISEIKRQMRSFRNAFEEYKLITANALNSLERVLNENGTDTRAIMACVERLRDFDTQRVDLLPRITDRTILDESLLDLYDKFVYELSNYQAEFDSRRTKLMEQAKNWLTLNALKEDSVQLVKSLGEDLNKKVTELCTRFAVKTDALRSDLSSIQTNLVSEFSQKSNALLAAIYTSDDVIIAQTKIRAAYAEQLDVIEKKMLPMVEHVEKLSMDINESLLQDVYRREYEKILRQWDLTRETAQLGTAVEIIDHEFNVLYAQINHDLKYLDEDSNVSSLPHYQSLEKCFQSLEEKYQLLSPLYRISGSQAKNIYGQSLYDFLRMFFETKLQRGNVLLTATDSFLKMSIYIKEPVIHTVLINVVNNALYWVQNSTTKIIELAYDEIRKQIIIRNSGEPIKDNKLQVIFDLFYSNRPQGRGLGLYLSKQSLEENYYTIYATNDVSLNTLNGACFVITPIDSNNL